MTKLEASQMYSTKKEYQLLLGDQKKRKDRNVRLLAKLDNIEKKAAFLQAKTDRIRSLKGFYKSTAVPPVLGHRVSFHERTPSTPTSHLNNNYPYEYYRPQHYPPFREEHCHNETHTCYNVKNISLDEAIEEISKRFVLIPKTAGNVQSNYSKTSHPNATATFPKDKHDIRSSDVDIDRRNLNQHLPHMSNIAPNNYSDINNVCTNETQEYSNENDLVLSEEENSQLSIKENTKKFSQEEISLEKDVSDRNQGENSVENCANIKVNVESPTNDNSVVENAIHSNNEVIFDNKILTNDNKLKEPVDSSPVHGKSAPFTLLNNISLDSPDISKPAPASDNNDIEQMKYEKIEPENSENLSQMQVESLIENQEINNESNPDNYSHDVQLNSEVEVPAYDESNYNEQPVELNGEYTEYDPTLQHFQQNEPQHELFDDQSQQIVRNADAMGQEIPYDATSSEYHNNYDETIQPDAQYVNDVQYEQQPEYDPNQQYYYEGKDESQTENPNQQYDYNTNNTTAEDIALDNEGHSELNTYSESNNLNTDTQNLEYNANEENQNYNENQEMQNVDYYQGQEYPQENYNTDEMQPNVTEYVDNEEYPDQSQTYAPEGEYSGNQEYNQGEYPSENTAYGENVVYQENTVEGQAYDEAQYTENEQNVQPLKVLESDTEADTTMREEPSRLESDFDFSSQQ